LAKIQLSYLTYGIVNINKDITYIPNEVLTSRHDSVFECYTCELDLQKKPGWLQTVHAIMFNVP